MQVLLGEARALYGTYFTARESSKDYYKIEVSEHLGNPADNVRYQTEEVFDTPEAAYEHVKAKSLSGSWEDYQLPDPDKYIHVPMPLGKTGADTDVLNMPVILAVGQAYYKVGALKNGIVQIKTGFFDKRTFWNPNEGSGGYQGGTYGQLAKGFDVIVEYLGPDIHAGERLYRQSEVPLEQDQEGLLGDGHLFFTKQAVLKYIQINCAERYREAATSEQSLTTNPDTRLGDVAGHKRNAAQYRQIAKNAANFDVSQIPDFPEHTLG